MKKILLILMVCIILASLLSPGAFALVNLKVPLKILREAPTDDANITFEIPIEVTMLSMTEDLNWFRVRIRAPFLDQTGWINIPVGSTFNVKLAPQNIP